MTDRTAAPATGHARRALVVRGGWEGHLPVETTEMFLPYLRDQGFEVDVVEDPQVYADAARMAATDLVLQCVTMSTVSDEAVAGLRTAVENGTGLAGWHGGVVDSFRASSDYVQLVGGQFASHPGRSESERVGDASDNFLRHTIEITDLGREHPVTAGLEAFELETEQYWVVHDDLIDVLATTTHPAPARQPWHRPVVSPAVWTRRWGRGRVLVATPGHDPDVLAVPQVRAIVERGLTWAARTASE